MIRPTKIPSAAGKRLGLQKIAHKLYPALGFIYKEFPEK